MSLKVISEKQCYAAMKYIVSQCFTVERLDVRGERARVQDLHLLHTVALCCEGPHLLHHPHAVQLPGVSAQSPPPLCQRHHAEGNNNFFFFLRDFIFKKTISNNHITIKDYYIKGRAKMISCAVGLR